MFYSKEEWSKYFDIIPVDVGYKIYDIETATLGNKIFMTEEGAFLEINKRLMKKEKQYLETKYC